MKEQKEEFNKMMKEQTQFNTMAKELNISVKDIATQCDYSERTAYDMFHGHGKKLPRAFTLAVYVWKEIKRITKIENTKKDHVLITLTQKLESQLTNGEGLKGADEIGMLKACKELGFGSAYSVDRLNEICEGVKKEKPIKKECTDLEWSLYTQVVNLKEYNKKLEFMVENGLGEEDLKNDITYPPAEM